jgi:hypothetical protein
MTGRSSTERILDVYLAPEADRLPDRVLEAALADIARTPQRRALRVPWRFPTMPAISRATGIAAVALVVVVGAGGLIYLNSRAPSGSGASTPPTSSDAPTTAPTLAPTATAAPTPTPSAWDPAPGITGWTAYTSEVYGITFGYPDHWHVEAPATRTWQAGDPFDFGSFADIFISPDNDVALYLFRMVVEPDVDIGSRDSLGALVCELEASHCEAISDRAEPMCLGRVACLPAVLVPGPGGIFAYFADPETRMVTIVSVGRRDSFAGSAQYGGSVQLLRSVLTTMDVFTPEPGQIPDPT